MSSSVAMTMQALGAENTAENYFPVANYKKN
jgi:hypothetical protein